MKFVLLGTAAIAAAALVTPLQAQEVIYKPGYCAQFYPSYQARRWRSDYAYMGHWRGITRAVMTTTAYIDASPTPDAPARDVTCYDTDIEDAGGASRPESCRPGGLGLFWSRVAEYAAPGAPVII